MEPVRRSSPSAGVVAAGVVAIVGSVLSLLGVMFALLGFLLMPATSSSDGVPPTVAVPAAARTMGEVVAIFFLALAIFGIFAGVGLLRLKEWARVSTLIWSGITVFFCGLFVVIFAVLPFPTAPDVPATFMNTGRILTALFYSIPLGIGVWWLIFFNLRAVSIQFRAAGSISGELPGEAIAEGLRPAKPAPPLPITVLAVFFLLSSLSFVFIFFMPAPVVLFGHMFRGAARIPFWVVSYGLLIAAGIGLLKLKPWSYTLTIALQAFWLVAGTVTLLSPNYQALMEEMLSTMRLQYHLESHYPLENVQELRIFSWIGMAFPILILGLLFYYRARFLKAATEAAQRD